jgi:hypothetical protein
LHVVHGWTILCVSLIPDVHSLRCWQMVDSRLYRVHGMPCRHVLGGGGCAVHRLRRWYIHSDVWIVKM